ncbi:excinuclease ABC subunit UvrC [Candidatus Babeliales bacterium]|nr:excinuclease ABC subunit UvrC [Candidatus Babeliales bacterium]MCF7899610.1 excinuclease ABC subunit UvrC [Candidatus Babeliales bacterium]
MKNFKNLDFQVQNIPKLPGVYIFKDDNNHILYIGKAKNLKKRVQSYFSKQYQDWKINSILQTSSNIEHIVTKTELDAMLLEAELIKANQPKFNILLKSGQPYIYILITNPKKTLPEIKIVRNKKEKGSYFGPFLEKMAARKVYNFLIKTFKLKLCRKKLEKGCLDYHMGICAGICKSDFDKQSYLERLNLAKLSLKQDHQKFLDYLQQQINLFNSKLEFEKSKELHEYFLAFSKIFNTIDTETSYQGMAKDFAHKNIWFLTQDKKSLFLFSENNSVLKQKALFYLPLDNLGTENLENKEKNDNKNYLDYFISYYHNFSCPNIILTNFEIDKYTKNLYENFLQKWHKKEKPVSIIFPQEGHFASLIKLAQIHVEQQITKQQNLSKQLKNLFKANKEIHTIDCFDISHKQGMWQTGSCVRFKDGQPDKNLFRKFKIKTIDYQDDYACLQEIIKRRYKDNYEIPDLILIDGGKGQLNAALKVVPNTEVASLAKKEETIFSKKLLLGKKLNLQNYASQVLIALRDYTHHFAIGYHRELEAKSSIDFFK